LQASCLDWVRSRPNTKEGNHQPPAIDLGAAMNIQKSRSLCAVQSLLIDGQSARKAVFKMPAHVQLRRRSVGASRGAGHGAARLSWAQAESYMWCCTKPPSKNATAGKKQYFVLVACKGCTTVMHHAAGKRYASLGCCGPLARSQISLTDLSCLSLFRHTAQNKIRDGVIRNTPNDVRWWSVGWLYGLISLAPMWPRWGLFFGREECGNSRPRALLLLACILKMREKTALSQTCARYSCLTSLSTPRCKHLRRHPAYFRSKRRGNAALCFACR
jgi:hypothetical protein